MSREPSQTIWQKELNRMFAQRAERIQKLYDFTAERIGKELYKYRGNPGRVTGRVVKLRREVQKILDDAQEYLSQNIVAEANAGTRNAWELGNARNDELARYFLKDIAMTPTIRTRFFTQNFEALNAFLEQTRFGMTLSERVWKRTAIGSRQIELYCGSGILEGKSAAELSLDVRDALQDPNRLFRRVRDEGGKLQLSEAAKKYHPGQGVYRSSFKNSLRLTREVNNSSFRYADHLRWKKAPYVMGVRVHLSASHPVYDICDEMQGTYPQGFHFPGWHVQCICYATPENMRVEEFNRYMNTGQIDRRRVIKDMPKRAKTYLAEKKDKILELKNTPKWMENINPQTMELKERVKP